MPLDNQTREYLDIKFELVSQQQNAILTKVDKIEQDFQKIDNRTIGHEKELGILQSMVKGLEDRFDKHELGEKDIGKDTNCRLNKVEQFIDAQKRDNYYINKKDQDIENRINKTGEKLETTSVKVSRSIAYAGGIVAGVSFLLILVKWILANWGSITGGFKL